MRSKTIFGALLVSVALCSQGFGFELLDRMLGLNNGGCGECKACAKVACCDPCKACPAPRVCEKACPPACEDVTCGKVRKCRATPVRDLFGDMKDLFAAKGCVCEPAACAAPKCCPEPCAKVRGCEKACEPTCERVKRCHKVRMCEKACGPCQPACEKACAPIACEPTCEKAPKCHKLYRRPVVELLEGLFACRDGGRANCEAGCEVGCEAGCGGTTTTPAATPKASTPKEAPAPLPQAPKADPSASTRGIYQSAGQLVRN